MNNLNYDRIKSAVALVLIVIAVGMAWIAFPPGATNAAVPPTPTPGARLLPANEPTRGLVYDGLTYGAGGNCAGLFRTVDDDLCTHGPDPAPPGVNVFKDTPPQVFATRAAAPAVVCVGDGVSGNRIQVVYTRASDRTDRYSTYLASMQQWAADADAIYDQSAAETGGSRRLRFVHDVNCNVVVANVALSPTGDDNYNNMVTELKSKGYNRTDRKYMIFMDANVYCGIGSIWRDDSPGQGNWNNGGPSYARIDNGCWGSNGGPVAAHEVMHNLGGVQLSAPNTSGGYHCVDEYDRMCYKDSPNYPNMQIVCANTSHDRLFDCNHDDYYHTNPPAGNYLATHWNAANNAFLIAGSGGSTPTPTPTPTATPTSTPVTANVVQESSTLVQYNNWRGVSDAGATGGAYRVSSAAGDKATFKFSGTGVAWVTRKGPDQGRAKVTIDGVNKGTLDLYSGSVQYNVAVAFGGLASASHTMVVQVLGTKSASSTGYNVAVDGFAVGATFSDDSARTVQYNTWAGGSNAAASGGTYRMSGTSGAEASFTFSGNAVSWVTTVGPAYGIAQVYIDGVNKGYVDLYAGTTQWRVLKSFSGLGAGTHTIRVRALGLKNPAATSTKVLVDAFQTP